MYGDAVPEVRRSSPELGLRLYSLEEYMTMLLPRAGLSPGSARCAHDCPFAPPSSSHSNRPRATNFSGSLGCGVAIPIKAAFSRSFSHCWDWGAEWMPLPEQPQLTLHGVGVSYGHHRLQAEPALQQASTPRPSPGEMRQWWRRSSDSSLAGNGYTAPQWASQRRSGRGKGAAWEWGDLYHMTALVAPPKGPACHYSKVSYFYCSSHKPQPTLPSLSSHTPTYS